ncbi:MAG TPA: amidase family protein [Candidatus Woesebacteria bacterium]|nr:amidase family protein [Candidatus Woesebacteria bacterium]
MKDEINAFITLIDHPSPGIPIAIKDNICTKGIRTTAGSKVLADFIPSYSATLVERLENAGFSIIGKTNLDAFAHGSSTENSDFGVTLNPYDHQRLPGGSSGGSAAAVGAGLVDFAIGTETAGSIRQPAAWCGVVGFKPTYGYVSRYGVIAMASSMDCPGVIANNINNVIKVFEVISGHDSKDATSLSLPPFRFKQDRLIDGLKIGIPKSYLKITAPEVLEKFNQVGDIFRKLGHEVIEIEMLDPAIAIAVYTILQSSEVSSNLARFDGIRYGQDRRYFNPENQRRILLGTYALSADSYEQYYIKALKVRTLIINDFNKHFKNIDVILAPTTPTTALPLGSSLDDPLFGEYADQLVEPSTLAGLPGITVPCSLIDGLPVGFQIIGPRLSENLILNLALQYESIKN